VTLLEGPIWVAGSLAGAAAAAPGSRAAVAIVSLLAGGLGALDDHAGTTTTKGLAGHLGALARGEVTTGALKIAGLALTGIVGTALVDRRRGGAGVFSTLFGGAVVAGAANAVNLFDLRPGRALKVAMAAAVPFGASTAAAPTVLGASAAVVGDDLAARSMLGDTGANAAGALVGLALVERTGLTGRAVSLAALAALTIASERVSFTQVIERSPVLRRLDEWGRPAR
jgi:UDP-N-acetylmuramyl pentapeptide phosphotransferase/UDP-N-acetylglucosamine-1-phosphate transferase